MWMCVPFLVALPTYLPIFFLFQGLNLRGDGCHFNMTHYNHLESPNTWVELGFPETPDMLQFVTSFLSYPHLSTTLFSKITNMATREF